MAEDSGIFYTGTLSGTFEENSAIRWTTIGQEDDGPTLNDDDPTTLRIRFRGEDESSAASVPPSTQPLSWLCAG